MPTSVALSSHFEDFIRHQVESGRYNNVNEVVRAGLRLLENQERLNDIKLTELRKAIAIGLESGEGHNADDVLACLEAKYQHQATEPRT